MTWSTKTVSRCNLIFKFQLNELEQFYSGLGTRNLFFKSWQLLSHSVWASRYLFQRLQIPVLQSLF